MVRLKRCESIGSAKWTIHKTGTYYTASRGTGLMLYIYPWSQRRSQRHFWMVGFVDGSSMCAADFFGLGFFSIIFQHGKSPKWLRRFKFRSLKLGQKGKTNE